MNKNIESRRNFLSKMLVTSLSGVALLTTATYAKGGKGGNSGRGSANTTSTTDDSATSTTVESTSNGMTVEQKDELFFIYQEEKVARDVYITLGKIYTDENNFASIQKSEQRHIDAARGLCEKYDVSIEGVDEGSVGNFVLPVLQDLYDTCVGLGEESLLDALKVGELIEVTDIKDLDHAINDLGMPDDVIRVYESLKEGSYNHLDAFQTAIERETA